MESLDKELFIFLNFVGIMEEPEGLEGLESTLRKLRQDQIGKLICS